MGENRLDKLFAVRLTQRDRERLERAAQGKGITSSALVRGLIRDAAQQSAGQQGG